MADSNFISGSSLLTADIDLLFEKFTIKQLHEIEKNVRAEIEKKKEDVRLMVGERYRDLIEAADTIAEMKQSFATVTKHISSMENQMSLIEEKNSNLIKNMKIKDKNNEFNYYYTLATQIKLLLDIPAKIWTLIETNEILCGTELFLLAQNIHNSLENDCNFAFPVLNWFPVVSRQWNTTKHFQKILIDFSTKQLKNYNIDAQILSQCFTVLLILNHSTIQVVFDQFLMARLDCIFDIFHRNDGNSKLKDQNCQIVYLIVNTLHLSFDLFANENEMLEKRIKNVFSANFNGRFQNVNLSNYILEIKNNLPRIDCRFAIDELKEKCTKWMEMVKMKVNNELSQFITFIKSINGLSIIRDTVLDVINEENEKWNLISSKLLKNDLQIWDDIFESLFLNQMRSIVDFHIGSAFTRIRNDLFHFYQQTLNDPKKFAIEKDISSFVWSENSNDLPSKINWCSSKNVFSNLMLKARGFTPFCEILCTHLNQDLTLLIEDVAHFQSQNFDVTNFLRISTKQEIENLLKNCEKLIDDDKLTTDQIQTRILALSRFLIAITELCPTLQICIKGLEKDKTTIKRDSIIKIDENWENEKTEIINESHKLLRKWKEIIIKNAENKLEKQIKSKSFEDSILYLPLWDTIEIEEENEEGKLISSIIRIPGQTSWYLLTILHELCLEINKAGPHFLPKQILQEMQSNILEGIIKTYENNILINNSISQMSALQLSFDINFITHLMSAKDDKSLSAQISNLITWIESNVDPFDLDVFNQYIEMNLKKCVQRASVILGALVNPMKTNPFLSMARISSTLNEQHNILTVNSSIPHFSLLPLANNNLI